MERDLWVVTTYFNSEGYASRRENYQRFRDGIERAGAPCLVIECAFEGRPYELEPSPRVIHRRSSSVMWQKERLLNVALDALPAACRKVAWVDADILFEDPDWYRACSRLLERCAVVQPFETVVRLPVGHTVYRGAGDAYQSYCSEYVKRPDCVREGWSSHGHTGFAWAARRDVLERCGFFDLCLSGSADHLMSHGFLGDADSHCIRWLIGIDTPVQREFASWAKRAHEASEGNLGFLPGRALHLWHGELEQRKYHERSQQFRKLRLDPRSDVRLAPNGCWEWTGANPQIEQWAKDLFADRREDG